MVEDLGTIQIEPVSFESAEALEYRSNVADMALSESQLEDEEGNTQEIALLSGATDNPFYQASSSASVAMKVTRPRPTSTLFPLTTVCVSRSTTR